MTTPNSIHYWLVTKSDAGYAAHDMGPISATINGVTSNRPAPSLIGWGAMVQSTGTPSNTVCATALAPVKTPALPKQAGQP